MASHKPPLTNGHIPGKFPANAVLNEFCKEKGIVMALSQPQINFIDDGSIIIRPAMIIAKYTEEINRPDPKRPEIILNKPDAVRIKE